MKRYLPFLFLLASCSVSHDDLSWLHHQLNQRVSHVEEKDALIERLLADELTIETVLQIALLQHPEAMPALALEVEKTFYCLQQALAERDLQTHLLQAFQQAGALPEQQKEESLAEIQKLDQKITSLTEDLSRLIGLNESSHAWKVSPKLPDLPDQEPQLAPSSPQVQAAYDQVLSARSCAEHFHDLLPSLKRGLILHPHRPYELGTEDVYSFLQKKRHEIQERMSYEHALCKYWIAKAELTRLLAQE